MGVIEIEGMEFYAFHGHFKEEQVVGNKFHVFIRMENNCANEAVSDELDDALDYHKVYTLIKEEMQIKSKLLENICNRILVRLYDEFDSVYHAKIKVSKINPPMGGQIQQVSVTMER